MIFGTWF
ncbi:Protein of unknown function [Bacillus wiedmannii]|nr:Protein of unknown function [Bacillus wiedmannii]